MSRYVLDMVFFIVLEVYGFAFRLGVIAFKISFLNLDPTTQYKIPLMLLFKYCVKFTNARNSGRV